MRKDALKQLLAKHPNLRTKMILLAIDELYASLLEDTDITFERLQQDLKLSGFSIEPSNTLPKDHSHDNALFIQFITGKKPPPALEKICEEKEEKSEFKILDKTT